MAKITKNLYLQGASGMLGSQLVYKTVNGETIVSTKPVRTVEASESQKNQQRKFKFAISYARQAITDATLGPIYEEATARKRNISSSFQMALTDYLRVAEIGELDFGSGTAGNPILVEAIKDPKLDRVEVAILSSDSMVMSVGEATPTANGIQWSYVLPSDLPANGKVEVRAYDLPGKVAVKVFDAPMFDQQIDS